MRCLSFSKAVKQRSATDDRSCCTSHEVHVDCRRVSYVELGLKLEPPETVWTWPLSLPGLTIGSCYNRVKPAHVIRWSRTSRSIVRMLLQGILPDILRLISRPIVIGTPPEGRGQRRQRQQSHFSSHLCEVSGWGLKEGGARSLAW
jgi:hypothetical protein